MSLDLSRPNGYWGRKAVLVIRIGFCSHLPDKSDTAAFSDVVLENYAGKIH